MRVKIYQAGIDYENKFMGYDFTMQHGGIDEGAYRCVYDGHLYFKTPDDIFYILNTRRPEGYTGHSLSVSDIVVIEGQALFCDTFGWKSISFGGACDVCAS